MHPTGDSEMTEQLEQWRSEFCDLLKKQNPLLPLTLFPDGSAFSDCDVWHRFEGFCMAKRAQKPLELESHDNECKCCEANFAAINAAGIPYKIKGE